LRAEGRSELLEELVTLGVAMSSLDTAAAPRVAGLVAGVSTSELATSGADLLTGSPGVASAAEHTILEAQVRGLRAPAAQAPRMDHPDLPGTDRHQGADEPVQHRRQAGRSNNEGVGVRLQVPGELSQATNADRLIDDLQHRGVGQQRLDRPDGGQDRRLAALSQLDCASGGVAPGTPRLVIVVAADELAVPTA